MKNITMAISFLAIPFVLVACTEATKVQVAENATDNTIVFPQQQASQSQLPTDLPANVTAICRDGSYSMAIDKSKCASNGGVKTLIGRYIAE